MDARTYLSCIWSRLPCEHRVRLNLFGVIASVESRMSRAVCREESATFGCPSGVECLASRRYRGLPPGSESGIRRRFPTGVSQLCCLSTYSRWIDVVSRDIGTLTIERAGWIALLSSGPRRGRLSGVGRRLRPVSDPAPVGCYGALVPGTFGR